MSDHEYRSKRKNRPSFIWPIILITVGVIFLLSNLGILGEDIWDNIWRLWPVIFIAIGLDSLLRRSEIAGPVFMIGLGIVFLLSSVGVIGWGAWDILWRLWPVLLVSIGLELIIGRRSLWVSITSVLLILAVLGSIMWFFGSEPIRGEGLTGNRVDQLLGNIDQAEITISPAVGDLDVNELRDSVALVSGDVSAGNNQQVYTDYDVSGTTGYFKIDSWSMANFPGSGPWNWDLGLSNKIPLDVELNMGAGDLNADLTGLTLVGLDVSQGVGELTVTLADKGNYSVDINQAVGSIVVEIPKAVGIRIELSKAISSLSMPSGFEHRGDYYYSSNYDTAGYQVDMEISQAIGSIVLRFD
jgi:hypothetical protein